MPAQALVCVECGEKRVLERRVLGRLLQVAVHLARRREDALDASGGGGCGEVLLDHLRERWPLGLLRLPPHQHIELNVLLLGLREVLLQLVELPLAATSNALVGVRFMGPLPLGFGGGGATALFALEGPRLPMSDT